MVKAAKHTTLETVVTTVTAADVIELCEAGRYREAASVVANVPADKPEGSLAHGLIAIQNGELEVAKNFFTPLAFGESELRDIAKYHLAVAYWFGGEANEAQDLLREIPDSFKKLLLKAIIEDRPRYALKFLDKAAQFPVRPGMQGRLHNERGKKLRQIGELDRAILEYQAAIHLFEQDRSDVLPRVVNNLARVYLDYGEFAQAHKQIDKAINMLEDDPPHLGQAYDEKSRIFLAEGKFEHAKQWSEKAVSVLRSSDRREWLAEALITKAKAQIRLGHKWNSTLDEAEKVCTYLQRQDLLIGVCLLRRDVAKADFEQSEKRLIEIALSVSGGKYRPAAERLGVTHPWISKMVRKYRIKK